MGNTCTCILLIAEGPKTEEQKLREQQLIQELLELVNEREWLDQRLTNTTQYVWFIISMYIYLIARLVSLMYIICFIYLCCLSIRSWDPHPSTQQSSYQSFHPSIHLLRIIPSNHPSIHPSIHHHTNVHVIFQF